MCGRFAVQVDLAHLLACFREFLDVGRGDAPDGPLRNNVAPAQDILIIRRPEGAGARNESSSPVEFATARWGFLPHWSKDAKKAMINARSETADTSRMFGAAFRAGRCLVPATGFYAWAETPNGKQPHFITMRDGRPFAFAAFHGLWTSPDGAAVDTVCILTTDANETVKPIHHRMPVILRPDDIAPWLETADARKAKALLGPYPGAEMKAHAVGKWVNNPRLDDPKCAEPLPAD